MTQRIILQNAQYDFHRELQGLLDDGYEIVPGTFYAASLKMRAQKKTPPEQIDPEGFCQRFVFMAVVSKRPQDRPAAGL